MVPAGLRVIPDTDSVEKEEELLTFIDTQPWSTELSRRTQHYGRKYDYNRRSIAGAEAPPIEGPLLEVAQWLSRYNVLTPEQCIVNEYTRGQGIAPHIDKDVFGPVVAGISLGGDAVMEFTRGTETYQAFLPRRSLLIMSGEARTQWKHALPKRVTYIDPQGTKISQPADFRRVSITFRTMI